MPEQIDLIMGPSDDGKRIDKCIALKLGEGYSRTMVKELLGSGDITVEGVSVKPRHIAREGEKISVSIPARACPDLEPENIPLSILHEDEHVVIVDKPAGMVVHPGAGNFRGTLVSALLYRFGTLPAGDGSSHRPGIVHRLDKDTSGVMVVAKSDKAMRSLSGQFRDRTVKKIYAAIVSGVVEMDNGVIDAPLSRQKTDRKKMGVEHSSGKPARTVYHVVERYGNFTFLRIDLFTGRTHQIRAHMKYIGHPVAGDAAYGGRGEISRQALHAETLGFTHPGTSQKVEFSSAMPSDMADLIASLKLAAVSSGRRRKK
jgi:23S rRNA pseudouridine1911/1915/1917 synthase